MAAERRATYQSLRIILALLLGLMATASLSSCWVETPRVTEQSRALASFPHTGLETSCIGCHLNARPVGLSGNPPFDHALNGGTSDCVLCHTSIRANLGVVWSGGQYSHAPTPTTCISCHIAARPSGPAGNPPFDHAQAGGSGDCVFCHTAIPANAGRIWSGAQFSHTPIPTSCASCHSAELPAATVLLPASKSIDLYEHAAQYNGTSDCASCHSAVAANAGTTWAGGTYNHLDSSGTAVKNCITCHVGNRPTTVVNGFDHTTSGTGDCASCHTKPGVTFAGGGGSFNHTPTPATCISCHASAVPSATTVVPAGATADQFLHSATYNGTADCVSCHTSVTANVGVVWSGGTWNHTGASGAAFTSTCLPCHQSQTPSSTSAVPNTADGFVHSTKFNGAGDCTTCHTQVAANLGVKWSGGFFNHLGNSITALGTCSPCHDTRQHHAGQLCTNCHSVSWPAASTTGRYGGSWGNAN